VEVDEEAFEEAVAVLGRAKAYELLGALAGELRGRFRRSPATDEEREQLAREAHKLISTTGLFGFTELSQGCLRLEIAARKNENVPATLEKARAACEAVSSEIASRLANAASSHGDAGAAASRMTA
jgi:HPt (histidine-containing phosphotransfer) domain-containing protein